MPIRNRPHYAWIVSFAGLLIAGAGTGIFNSALGVFIKPVCEDQGFLRGQFALCASISMIVCIILMPFFGVLFKRFGIKRVAVFSALMCALGLFGYSVSSRLWHFYAIAFVSGLFMNGFGIMAIGILVNQWFIDRKGLATGIAFSGSGLLAAVLIPMANRFIELNGWRWTYRFLACVSLGILIPVLLFIVKDRPEDIGLEPYRSMKAKKQDGRVLNDPKLSAGDTGMTRGEAFRTASFRYLVIAVLGIALCQAGAHVHTISFLSDIGYPMAFVSAVSSSYLIFLTVFKVVIGMAFDRLGSLKGSLLIGGSCALFPVFALLAGFPAAPWIYAPVLGLASSGATILGPILTANYFGGRDFSRIYSMVSMSSYIGFAASSPYYGAVFDTTGSYSFAFVTSMVMGLVVCICLIGAYRTRRIGTVDQAVQRI